MSDAARSIAAKLTTALEQRDEELFASLLDPAVRWGGEGETPETCHGREQVVARYRRLRESGVGVTVEETICRDDVAVLALALSLPQAGRTAELPPVVYQVFTIARGLIVDIRGFRTREDAVALLANFDSGR
ncbi:MAG TPA: nuclear transport factor 2 family protein [Solirubrobacterales bacterium]|nr:nuclear transport factor 2 family protein [Solirubrobacterales bacterium]